MPDLVLINAGELVTCAGRGPSDQERLGVIEDGALVADGGRITWVGTTRELRGKAVGRPKKTIDAGGDLVTPGFVDPHTHLAFAGSREDELERKTSGESYISILKSGGGIARTVRETRTASLGGIVRQASDRVSHLLRNGVTTVEVKTGYGLDLKNELKLLKAAARIGRAGPLEVVPTFLGHHARPRELGDGEDYVKYATDVMLPAVAKLRARPKFSDCFCEPGVFSREECSRYLQASRDLGFALKLHADEFADSGGAALAAQMKCASADHLGRSAREGVVRMAEEGVVAVLLPGTSLYSGIPYADAKMVLEAGCTVALGTDLSPNSWIESPQYVMGLACAAMKLTPAQAIAGFTKNAALALGRDDVGSLATGCKADFLIHALPGHRFLPYRVGGSYVQKVFKEGAEVYSASEG